MGGRTVGIDLGTSTTLVAERTGENLPRVVPIGDVTPWMPSVIGMADDHRLVAGEQAQRLGVGRSVRSIKSALTAGLDEVKTPAGAVSVKEGIRALVSEALNRAEERSPGVFKEAEVFVGCPALWTGHQRRLLVDVLHECGLDVDIGDVVDEPVAAGLHWINSTWFGQGVRPTGRSLIFDAGGGTLDVAYLDVAGIDRPSMTVLSAEGRPESGDALDDAIARHLESEMDGLPTDELFGALLRLAARDLKEALTFADNAVTSMPAPHAREIEFTRVALEEVFGPQLDRAVRLTKSALAGALLRVAQPLNPAEIRSRMAAWSSLAAEVNHVTLVGGLGQVPVVRRELQKLFPTSSVTLVDRPQESVVQGLTYGDRLDELNLPRPPVDFYITFPELEGKVEKSWLDEHRLVYSAFSPLYTQDQLVRGQGLLGYEADIPAPPGNFGTYTAVLRCVMPNRSRQTLKLRFQEHGRDRVGDGISLLHDNSRPIRFKLYTNGEFVVRSSRQTFKAKVDQWPTLRGQGHSVEREIRLRQLGRTGPSQLRMDDWRFQ